MNNQTTEPDPWEITDKAGAKSDEEYVELNHTGINASDDSDDPPEELPQVEPTERLSKL